MLLMIIISKRKIGETDYMVSYDTWGDTVIILESILNGMI